MFTQCIVLAAMAAPAAVWADSLAIRADCPNPQVIVQYQPFLYICSGSSSSSTTVSTSTTCFSSAPAPTTATITSTCSNGCLPTTIPPLPGCTLCTATVLTPLPSPSLPLPITTTITSTCPGSCTPTTIPASSGCTLCTETVVTPGPSSSGIPVPTSPTSSGPSTSSLPVATTTTLISTCTNGCLPTTIPPLSGCTLCTEIIITPLSSPSLPLATTTTVTSTCTTNGCSPTTIPPSSGCVLCTATVVTPLLSSSSSISSSLPTPVTTTVTSTCTNGCSPTTIPPSSGCVLCTETVVTPLLSSSSLSSAVTTTAVVSSSAGSSSSSSSATTSSSAVPTISPIPCSRFGYLSFGDQFRKVDLVTLETTILTNNTISGYNDINAIGYNVKDGFVYGVTNASDPHSPIVKIGDSGAGILVPNAVVPFRTYIGDMAPDGTYWILGDTYARTPQTGWAQMDFSNPALATYGKVISQGLVSPYNEITDWAYVPGNGSAFYGFANSYPSPYQVLFRFDAITHKLEFLKSTPPLAFQNVVSVFGTSDSWLYAYAASGDLYRINIANSSSQLTKLATGPPGTGDGARCILVPADAV